MPSVSVIIPTYNGAQRIANLLNSLKGQSFNDLEVIVVVDGSTDDTKGALNDFIRKNPDLNISVTSIPNSGRSIARNTGATCSQSNLLIFLDDDVRIANMSFIQRHVSHHEKIPDSILGGMPLEDITKLTTDIQRYRRFLSLKWIKPLSNHYPNPIPEDQVFLSAANFSISKQVFEKLNGFDEQLRDGEDQNLAIRAAKQNVAVYFDKDLVVWHDDFITCRKYINRQKEYNAAQQAVQGSNLSLSLFKQAIFYLFSFKFWIWIIDSFNFLIILPKYPRFKIYDLVITSQSKYFPCKHSAF